MKDMTKGSIIGAIISFSIPMLISSIFQQLYSLVDTYIVSRYLGPDALAGVGATGLLTFLMLCITLGMGAGGGLIIAQCYGSKNYEKLRSTIISMSYIMLLLAAVMSFVGFVYSRKFLVFLKVPNNVLDYSVTYIRIIFVFSIGTVLYNLTSSILRSVGDSKTPLYALIAASFINIGLDLFFILKLNMGVAGAAYATVISQFVSGLICLVIIIRKRADLSFNGVGSLLPDAHTLLLIIRTSLPSTFQSSLITLGGISVQRLINSFGSDVMAGYVAASKVDSLAIQVILSVGNALCVFTGQNIGIGNLERIEKALKKSRIIMFFSAVVIAICAYTFRFCIVGIFLDADANPLALNTGAQYLSIVGVAYLICAIMQSYQNVIKGAGDVNTCMVAGLTELAGKIIFAYAASPFLGPLGIWISTPFSWACGCVIPVVRYYSGKWKFKTLA
ncbi:MATE family efflux transporter [Butyrivibrio sp. FCS006]|uniref:MATE family efflux transporter n=1 Tax=Butyrivibrio sp. FCS006 TaxID=1280684 RepID=UPI00040468A3|nr:MATE family efflux transporter [Butyrivibrio sp. FCS006]